MLNVVKVSVFMLSVAAHFLTPPANKISKFRFSQFLNNSEALFYKNFTSHQTILANAAFE
jgi:hypothetical protein